MAPLSGVCDSALSQDYYGVLSLSTSPQEDSNVGLSWTITLNNIVDTSLNRQYAITESIVLITPCDPKCSACSASATNCSACTESGAD